ncbi:hypothetical protein [Rhodobacter maris]|uniref:Uncharacterized protein n=1 Tax=Rhodobacter maris TaxID=446682 RepID=A0A285TC98_9RHOB|nr:hypothetical protein [Rhodobacter maris]SOC19637.1 hypothetical protein SAMN05877831_11827 [Rhodobacter maris]
MTDFVEYRAADATTPNGRRGGRRSILPLLRRLKSLADRIENCWIGDVLGALSILAFMILIPLFLPIIVELCR